MDPSVAAQRTAVADAKARYAAGVSVITIAALANIAYTIAVRRRLRMTPSGLKLWCISLTTLLYCAFVVAYHEAVSADAVPCAIYMSAVFLFAPLYAMPLLLRICCAFYVNVIATSTLPEPPRQRLRMAASAPAPASAAAVAHSSSKTRSRSSSHSRPGSQKGGEAAAAAASGEERVSAERREQQQQTVVADGDDDESWEERLRSVERRRLTRTHRLVQWVAGHVWVPFGAVLVLNVILMLLLFPGFLISSETGGERSVSSIAGAPCAGDLADVFIYILCCVIIYAVGAIVGIVAMLRTSLATHESTEFSLVLVATLLLMLPYAVITSVVYMASRQAYAALSERIPPIAILLAYACCLLAISFATRVAPALWRCACLRRLSIVVLLHRVCVRRDFRRSDGRGGWRPCTTCVHDDDDDGGGDGRTLTYRDFVGGDGDGDGEGEGGAVSEQMSAPAFPPSYPLLDAVHDPFARAMFVQFCRERNLTAYVLCLIDCLSYAALAHNATSASDGQRVAASAHTITATYTTPGLPLYIPDCPDSVMHTLAGVRAMRHEASAETFSGLERHCTRYLEVNGYRSFMDRLQTVTRAAADRHRKALARTRTRTPAPGTVSHTMRTMDTVERDAQWARDAKDIYTSIWYASSSLSPSPHRRSGAVGGARGGAGVSDDDGDVYVAEEDGEW
jgi:hypothetical protein